MSARFPPTSKMPPELFEAFVVVVQCIQYVFVHGGSFGYVKNRNQTSGFYVLRQRVDSSIIRDSGSVDVPSRRI